MAVGEQIGSSVYSRRPQPTALLPVRRDDLEVRPHLQHTNECFFYALARRTRCFALQAREIHAVGSRVSCVASFDCGQRKL